MNPTVRHLLVFTPSVPLGMIGPGPNLLSDWSNNLGLSQSAHNIPLSTFMGVGVSRCPMLASPGQGEVGREFLMVFFFFFF